MARARPCRRSPTATCTRRARHGDVLDYFHVNSIDPLADGELLISSRNTWAVYLISETTGAVVWQLGGQVRAASRSDRACASPGSTTPSCSRTARSALRQRGRARARRRQSRARRHRARPDEPHREPRQPAHLSRAGDPLREPGQRPASSATATRSSAGGRPASLRVLAERRADVRHAPRRRRRTATARSATPGARSRRHGPRSRVASPTGRRTELWASWNGATGVAAWRVLAGDSRAPAAASSGPIRRAGSRPRSPRRRRKRLSASRPSAAGACCCAAPRSSPHARGSGRHNSPRSVVRGEGCSMQQARVHRRTLGLAGAAALAGAIALAASPIASGLASPHRQPCPRAPRRGWSSGSTRRATARPAASTTRSSSRTSRATRAR